MVQLSIPGQGAYLWLWAGVAARRTGRRRAVRQWAVLGYNGRSRARGRGLGEDNECTGVLPLMLVALALYAPASQATTAHCTCGVCLFNGRHAPAGYGPGPGSELPYTRAALSS